MDEHDGAAAGDGDSAAAADRSGADGDLHPDGADEGDKAHGKVSGGKEGKD